MMTFHHDNDTMYIRWYSIVARSTNKVGKLHGEYVEYIYSPMHPVMVGVITAEIIHMDRILRNK